VDRVNIEQFSNESHIGGWFIDRALCDAIVTEFEDKSDQAKYDKFRQYHRIVARKQTSDVQKKYVEQLHGVVDEYRKAYSYSNYEKEWGVMEPWNIQKYFPGNHYATWHMEQAGPKKDKLFRHLVFMTYLNDVRIGGETEFLYQQIKVKPQKGLTLIWPAGWTHIHRGCPAFHETKYIATGWCNWDHRC